MNQTIQVIAARYNIAACPPPQKFIPTGFKTLDAVTGGVPKGRIVDVYGTADAGKTALALSLARGNVLYIDAENKLSPWMVQKRKGLYVAHAESLESALEICRIAAAGFDTIVLDTIEALPEAFDPWTTISEPRENSRERLMSNALPVLVPLLYSNGCTLITVNQVRCVYGIFRYERDHSTGGKALDYYAALQLEVRRIDNVRENGERTGQKIMVRVAKSKYHRPGGAAELVLDYRRGLCAK